MGRQKRVPESADEIGNNNTACRRFGRRPERHGVMKLVGVHGVELYTPFFTFSNSAVGIGNLGWVFTAPAK